MGHAPGHSIFLLRTRTKAGEAGEFIIPKNEGAITDAHVKGELGEVLLGTKKGREHPEEITIFKSLGIACEDIFSAWHIYQKIMQVNAG